MILLLETGGGSALIDTLSIINYVGSKLPNDIGLCCSVVQSHMLLLLWAPFKFNLDFWIISILVGGISWENHTQWCDHSLRSRHLGVQSQEALGSITTNKASGGDRIQLSYFKYSKMMPLKSFTQYASKFGKLNSGRRTGKCQFSFQFQRKAMPKNVQTTVQLISFHMLAR